MISYIPESIKKSANNFKEKNKRSFETNIDKYNFKKLKTKKKTKKEITGTFDNKHIEHKSEGNEIFSIRTYLSNMAVNLRMTMKNNFEPSKDSDEKQEVNTNIDNIEIMTSNKAGKIVSEFEEQNKEHIVLKN